MKRGVLLAGLLGAFGMANAQDHIRECEGGTVYLNRLAPVWHDPSQDASSFTILYRDGELWGYWTLYDELGQPMWLLFSGDLAIRDPDAPEDDFSHCLTESRLYRFTGPPYPSDGVTGAVHGEAWDGQPGDPTGRGRTITIQFLSQNRIRAFHGSGGFASFAISLDLVPFD